MMQKAAVSYYPSYIEEQAIHKINPEIPVKSITAYVYDKFLDKIEEDFEKREGLVFVGGFAHPPNADAVLWFAREIFPADSGTDSGHEVLRSGIQSDRRD